MLVNVSPGCSSCVQSICGGSGGEQCRFILGPEQDCVNTSCGAVGNSSIIRCNGTAQSLLTLTSSPIEMRNCVENRTFENQGLLSITTGFYIVGNLRRFCSTQCFGRILIGSSSNPNLPSSENPIQFHVYKRYMTGTTFVDYFVEQETFNVSLNHSANLSVYEATPRDPVCVERGDYIGFTLTEDIGLVGVNGAISSAGSYINASPSPQCSGITSQVFRVGRFSDGPIPLISFEQLPGQYRYCKAFFIMFLDVWGFDSPYYL